jgi:hypothetical protein
MEKPFHQGHSLQHAEFLNADLAAHIFLCKFLCFFKYSTIQEPKMNLFIILGQ